MSHSPLTTWDRLREYAATISGSFTSQEAITWFARHYPGTHEGTLRAHIRGAAWNVGDRSQFSAKEPFLTRIERGVFRRISDDEVGEWRLASEAHRQALLVAADPDTALAQDLIDEIADFGDSEDDWFSEENTQRLLVAWLRANGWQILREANTATRERGIDVVAERDGERLGVEVKGYPSRFYVAGPKRGEAKKTSPAQQAPKWFAHAIVPAMKLRTQEPASRSAMAFPDFPVYRTLWGYTRSSLQAAWIEVWLVTEAGDVEFLA